MRALLRGALVALLALVAAAQPVAAQRIGPSRLIHVKVGTGLGTGETEAAIRVVPVSASEAFLIAPHPLGALALHLINGNGGDLTTPQESVGAPYGGWRIRGYRLLPSVSSNPVTGYTEIVSDGIGSQQIAIRRNSGGGWVGVYHGFGAGAPYTQTAPDLTSAGMIASGVIASAGRGLWSDGAYFDFADAVELTPVGAIRTTTSVAMPFDPAIAYLDMTIVSQGFIRASLDGGTTWLDLLDLAPSSGTMAADAPSVMLRNPNSGTVVTIADDALNGTLGRAKFIMRRSQFQPGDFKVYPDLNPTPGGTLLGNVSIERTITISGTAPDPTVTLSPASASVAEGNSGSTSYTFTVQRASTAGAASIPWTFAAGSATADDFAAGALPSGGTVSLADGVASGSFTVSVASDTAVEAAETFSVSIRAPLGYAPGAVTTAAATILNDDAGVVYVWSGAVNGNAGYISSGWNPAMRTWDSAAKQLVFTRATNTAGGNHRTMFQMSGLAPGQAYQLPVAAQIVGGSPSAGVTLGVSTDCANGGGQSGTKNMDGATASGTTPYPFTATAATMCLVINQGPLAGSDNVFRLSSLGPIQ